MDFLDRPYIYPDPAPGETLELHVVRYQVGLSTREVDDPPRPVIRPTIRFHLPPEDRPGEPPYVDFTNQILLNAVLVIYDQRIAAVLEGERRNDLGELRRLSPAKPEPLTLQLTRQGTGLQTVYNVKVVEE